MVTTRPELLWTNEASWPNQPTGLIFTVPAVDRIGRQMFGAEWQTAQFLEEADPLPPISMDGVDRFWRNIVHRTLKDAHGSYEPSLGRDPRQQDSALGLLGSGFSSSLATLGQLTVAEPTSRLADLGRQQDLVYLFTDTDWAEARRIIHDKNSQRLPAIERNRAVARWLSDNIIAGNVATFLIRLDSNETREGSVDAWYAVDIDRIVRRLRSCRMSPARPDDTKSGSHFIYFRLTGFEIALPGARLASVQAAPVSPFDVGLASRPQGPSIIVSVSPPATSRESSPHIVENAHLDPDVPRKPTKRRGAPNLATKDRPFIEMMRKLVEDELHSPNKASEIIMAVHRANVAGVGKDESKARRLRDGYNRDRQARGLGRIGD